MPHPVFKIVYDNMEVVWNCRTILVSSFI